MTRFSAVGLVLVFAWVSILPLYAQQPGAESVAAWESYQDVQLPEAGTARYFDFLLTPSVFDRARQDLADLRLYDGAGREVPYALRVPRAEDRQQVLPAQEFNRAKADGAAEVSLDLGAAPPEHNEIVVSTGGTDFRRRVRLEGGDDGKTWRPILDAAVVVHYLVANKVIDVRRLHYPTSRFRYLRLHVLPDASNKDDVPTINSATVYHSVQEPGEYVTLPAVLGLRDLVRTEDGPGSAWILDLGGAGVPCERLQLDVAENDFVRPYRLEILDEEGGPRPVMGGEWRRRAGGEQRPLEIRFPEVTGYRLRLVVIDNRNPALTLTAARYTAAARQVVFARPENPALPYRLYFGNPQAEFPRYDFAGNLPATLQPQPARGTLVPGDGGVSKNPVYQPVPKPWTERWPWMVYVVLGLSSLVLLLILAQLAREAIARHDAVAPSAA